jgi:hypothetical protein
MLQSRLQFAQLSLATDERTSGLGAWSKDSVWLGLRLDHTLIPTAGYTVWYFQTKAIVLMALHRGKLCFSAVETAPVRVQPGEAVGVHRGLQPGQLHSQAGLPETVKHLSLTSIQARLIKTGGRLVRHARGLCSSLHMLTRILERISRVRLAPGYPALRAPLFMKSRLCWLKGLFQAGARHSISMT